MSGGNDMKRLTRLSAIILQLQTRKIVSSTELAERFEVSTRTIYRDIRVLEQIGIPIATIEGKGYSLADGYKVPPIMFSQQEANALITVEQLLQLNKDSSLMNAFRQAVDKVRAVLSYTSREKTELLSSRLAVSPVHTMAPTSNSLTLIQNALTSFTVLCIRYQAESATQETNRLIEPFAFYYSGQQYWTLIAYCRLRNDFRMFRLDRISEVHSMDMSFTPHELNLRQYLQEKEKNFISPDKQLS